MNPPFTADTVYLFSAGGAEVAASPVATIRLTKGWRVVLLDTADSFHLVELTEAGAFRRLVAGPVTGLECYQAAERTLAGVSHGSVTTQVNALAIGVIAGLAERAGAQSFDGGGTADGKLPRPPLAEGASP